MRIVFVGCVNFSYTLLNRLLSLQGASVVGVVTRKSSKFNTDFCSLNALASEKKIPFFIDVGNSQEEMATWIASLSPDVIFCFGWPYLLQKQILAIPPLGVLGYHPTELPKNRGRHPIIWTLALGLKETASSFYFMDEGVDSGDILSQEKVTVGEEDNAFTLYERLKIIAVKQLEEFTPRLISGGFTRVPQNHDKANVWRKRTSTDGKVDWRMPAAGIYNLVRALTKPYPGAHIETCGFEIKVWHCKIIRDTYSPDLLTNLEPGRVLAISGNVLDVRCGEGVIRLLDWEYQGAPPIVGACL
jgi:methionyl-tRNA formyltransferase